MSEEPPKEPIYMDTTKSIQQVLELLLAGGVALDVVVAFVLFSQRFIH